MQEQVFHFPLLILYIRVVVSQPEGENNQENQFQISSEQLFNETEAKMMSSSIIFVHSTVFSWQLAHTALPLKQ